jgi:type II secretory pathway pseudopilin PulG
MRFAIPLEVPRRPRSRGFTLIEGLVLVAAVGLLTTVGVTVVRRTTAEAPPHNAAVDLVQTIERARILAIQRKNDIWLIVYPGFNKKGRTRIAGQGAYFLIEDRGGAGVGREFDPVRGKLSPPNGKLLEEVYLESYSGKVRFRLPKKRLELEEEDAPFGGLRVTASCTFCTAGSRGAIIFSPDNTLRFVDGSGAAVAGDHWAHALVLVSDRTKHTTVIGLSGPTPSFGAYKK